MRPTAEDPREALRWAANVIRRNGWTRHAFVRKDGERCILGALRLCTKPMSQDNVRLRAQIMIAAELRRRGFSLADIANDSQLGLIPSWNDFHAKDATEVIDVLEAAARVQDPAEDQS